MPAVRDDPPEEPGGRRPGELAEVAAQMRLVVVAAFERELGEADVRVAPEELERPVEAKDSRDGLGGKPDLLAEARDEMTVAAAEVLGQGADTDTAAASLERLPRPGDVRRGPARVCECAEEECVEDLEPVFPRLCGRDSLGEVPGARGQDVLEIDGPVRELVHRQPEQHVRCERCQVHLDAARRP